MEKKSSLVIYVLFAGLFIGCQQHNEKPKPSTQEPLPSVKNCQTLEQKDYEYFIQEELTHAEREELNGSCAQIQPGCLDRVQKKLYEKDFVLQPSGVFEFLAMLREGGDK